MPFITRLPALTGADPYPDALLALDFVGARRGPQYYKSGGVTVSDITQIPGWTYTGGTPAGTGSYAPKADGSLQFFPSYTNAVFPSVVTSLPGGSNKWNANWNGTSSSIVANDIAAPDGTLTAAKITTNAINEGLYYRSTTLPAANNDWTYSIWVYVASTTTFSQNIGHSGGTAWTNITSPTVVVPGGVWTRVSLTRTAASSVTASTVTYALFTATSGSVFWVWGGQGELGSTASTYIPTTTAAVTVAPPRITDAGYLAEESRTNSLPNSTATNGAVAGTPGTLPTGWVIDYNPSSMSTQVVGTGTEGGLPYVDVRIFGTFLAASQINLSFSQATVVVASQGQTWTGSVYARSVAGSTTNLSSTNIAINEFNATGTYLVSGGITYPLSALSSVGSVAAGRQIATRTLSNASVARVQTTLVVVSTSGGAVDVTLRIAAPQLEQGSFATSPIPTTSVAVTRAADVGYISGLTVPSSGTLVASFTSLRATGGSANEYLAALSDGTANNRVSMFRPVGDTSMQERITSGGVGYNPGALAGYWTTGNLTGAITYTVGIGQAAMAGATGTTSTPASIGTMNRLSIGNAEATGAAFLNSPIRHIVIYPRAMSNSELQAITTAGAY
jgi:hypothetical protein